MRTQKDFKTVLTKDGYPALTAGGGSFTNTYKSILVLDANRQLKPASFIRRTGMLANEMDQAIIPVVTGDIIIELSGKLPVNDQNPDAHITGWKITHFTNQYWIVGEEIPIKHSEIPRKIIEGTSIYHNRNGEFFCDGEQP